MPKPLRALRMLRALLFCGGVAGACATGTAALAQTWLEPGDRFVSRGGARADEAYTRGQLGVLLPSYGRKSLYAAYRVLLLPPGATATESHARRRLAAAPGPEAKDVWLEARARVRADTPRPVDYFKRLGAGLQGVFGNCGGDAFITAARNLEELRGVLPERELRAWIEGQDAVFDQCAWSAGEGPAPALPAVLDAEAHPLLRALRAYQQASALFYRGEFAGARAGFDALVATPRHPLRQLAVLGSLRSTVRAVTLDLEWEQAFAAAYARGLRDAALTAALAEAGARQRERHLKGQEEVERRARQFLDDPQFAALAPLINEIVYRSATQLTPERVMGALFNALDQLERNPYTNATLDRWDALYPRVIGRRFVGPAAEAVRQAHPFFDWQLTIQACNDDPDAADAAEAPGGPAQRTADCAAAHQRALARWQGKPDTAWLVAVLLTLREPRDADLPAIEAARQARDGGAALPTLQYHAARALRRLGRLDEARALVEVALTRRGLDASAINLFRQERFALARNLPEAAAAALRVQGGNLPEAVAADGGALFDSRLGSDALLALAGDATLPALLREQLAAAAWFRAELAERPEVAVAAARLSASLTPVWAGAAQRYALADAAEARRDIVVQLALTRQFSPRVYQSGRYRPGTPLARGNPLPTEWCAFGGKGEARQQAVERVPALPAGLQGTATASDEQRRLQALGDGPGWLAHRALALARRQTDAALRANLLRQTLLIANADSTCPLADAAAVQAQARQLLGGR